MHPATSLDGVIVIDLQNKCQYTWHYLWPGHVILISRKASFVNFFWNFARCLKLIQERKLVAMWNKQLGIRSRQVLLWETVNPRWPSQKKHWDDKNTLNSLKARSATHTSLLDCRTFETLEVWTDVPISQFLLLTPTFVSIRQGCPLRTWAERQTVPFSDRCYCTSISKSIYASTKQS